MRLITWSHDPQAKTASIDPPRKMRPLPIWNQRVHSQKAFGVWLVKNSSSMFQDHQWCWGRQFDLESHGWDPRRWYPIRGRGIHATEAFLCFIGSVESLNDVFWRCPLYIYIHTYYSITIICTSCTSAQATWNAHHPIAVGWLSIKPCLSWAVPPSFPNWSLSRIISLACHERWNCAISTWRDSLLSLGWTNKKKRVLRK